MGLLKILLESMPKKITKKQYKTIKGKQLKNHFYVENTDKHEVALRALVTRIKLSGQSFSKDSFQTVESFVNDNNVYGSIDGEKWFLLGNIVDEDCREVKALLKTSMIDKLTIKHSGKYAYNKVGYNVYLNFYGSKEKDSLNHISR